MYKINKLWEILYPSIFLDILYHCIYAIVRCCVLLIGVPVEPDTLHAVLRLLLRLTRQNEYAMQFAELGGPRLLLGLTQASAFQGFTSLATLLIRHVMEEPETLKHTLDKVCYSYAQQSSSNICSDLNFTCHLFTVYKNV